ncbi:OmpH family outer membrane protein [Roseibacterium beibuensis]|uniref:OmpH family outer membrane protein n=1 Tax=[Roseibacterium] beibuensis TaxID=1193142 RepID=UPI0031EC7DBE|nr:OmpH family outer membrane protein [Roseibacterium beibuensis]
MAAAAFLAAPLAAQESAAPPPQGGVVVLNQEQLVSGTRFGQRIQRELEAASSALSAQNRRIEAQLTEEELDLTELRDTMAPEEFRALADEFDTRVEEIRAAQAAKARDLQTQAEAAQSRFFELSFPILLELVRDRGAAVLMDSRAVLLSAESVDITAAAIVRIDGELGEGGDTPLISVDGVYPVAPDSPVLPQEDTDVPPPVELETDPDAPSGAEETE